MRSKCVAIGIALCAIAASNCGGSDSGSPSPMAPTPQPPAGNPPVTIAIVGDRGNQSFSPNPATVAQGQALVFRNNDNTVHRIFINDNSLDSGNINPNATSGHASARANEGGGVWSQSRTHTKVKKDGTVSSRTRSMAHEPGGPPVKSTVRSSAGTPQ